MSLQPNIRKALQAEIAYLKEEKEKQRSLSNNELRSLGLIVFPLECKKANYQGNQAILQLRASFHINDTHFYRGCKVMLVSNDHRIEGRLQDLSAFEMEVVINSEEDFNPHEGTLQVSFEPDDRTNMCMELGLRFLEEKPHLIEIEKNLCTAKNPVCPFESNGLNEKQQIAAGAILSSEISVCIQGPPGTGKTTVLAQSIAELVNQNKQIIICAPSNTALDNLCIRLLQMNIPLLRVGNDEKINEVVLPYTIEGYLDRTQGKLVSHLEKSIQQQLTIANRFNRTFNAEAKEEKRAARNELKSLRTELRQLQKQVSNQLLSELPVIAGTPVGLFNNLPKEKMVDIVIIDEAGQALSPLCWLAASFGKRLVLCGDPQQLPPVVFSPEAKKLGLGESLLEASFNKTAPYLLETQYRFGTAIESAINPFFYQNALKTFDANPESEFYFIDTAGYGNPENKDEITGSTYNLTEIEVIEKLLSHFEINSTETVILSPYNAQIDEIQKQLNSDWKVSTIDSMQGQETPICVISLTRSNDNAEIGFLKDYRRLNVAISRAKYKCYLVGDSATLGNDNFYSSIIQYAEQNGSYLSCYEFMFS